MWTDKESSVDYLHFEEIAFVAKNILEDESLRSTSIGIFGSWGSGKSTILELIKNELSKKDDVIIICFDAWLHQNYSDAKTSLLEIIQRKLEDEVGKDGALSRATVSEQHSQFRGTQTDFLNLVS